MENTGPHNQVPGAGGWEEAETALDWRHKAGERFDLLTITEVRGEAQVDLAAEYADILQGGTRNMYHQDPLISNERS